MLNWLLRLVKNKIYFSLLNNLKTQYSCGIEEVLYEMV